jgi:histidinol-phosphate aminotransferase
MGAAGAAITGSPFPLNRFEPGRHGQVVGAKTAFGTSRSNSILLNSNENAYGPLPKAAAAMRQALTWANRYPDFDYDALVGAICDLHKVKTNQLVIGCGSTEILRVSAAALLGPGTKLIVADPTFEAIQQYAGPTGAEITKIRLTSTYAHHLDAMLAAAAGTPSLIYVCNPNNPTASLTPRKDLDAFIAQLPGNSYVLIDEAYHHFATHSPDYRSFLDRASDNPRVIVARTFSKIYGMAGLRLGYGISSPETAQRIRKLETQDNANMIAARAAIASLEDAEETEAAIGRNANDRQEFFAQAARRGLNPIPSFANFVMMEAGRPVGEVANYFKQKGVLVGRRFPTMENFVRVSLGRPSEMQQFWKVWDAMKSAP